MLNSWRAGVDQYGVGHVAGGAGMTPSLVTIGIPTYNRVASLRGTLTSALAQDYPSLEVLISDNGSSDGTEAYCRSLERSDPRVRYIRQLENQGPLANFRAVLDGARGQYFMWLADDDRIEPNYVSECVAVLDSEPRTVLVAGRASLRYPDGSTMADVVVSLDAYRPERRVLVYYRSVGRNSVFYGVGRTAALREAGPMARTLGSDWLFVATLAFKGVIRTVGTTAITRSASGESEDLRRLARSFGLGPVARVLPRLSLAGNIGLDLARSPTYHSIPRRRRLVLAGACAASVAWRLGVCFNLLRVGYALQRRLPASSRLGQFRSRSDIVSVPTSGQSMPISGSSNRTP